MVRALVVNGWNRDVAMLYMMCRDNLIALEPTKGDELHEER